MCVYEERKKDKAKVVNVNIYGICVKDSQEFCKSEIQLAK